MTRRWISRRAALAMLAVLPLAGCSAGRWFREKVPDGTVTGTVAWREPLALPPGATLVVRLEELARPGASPVLIAEQTVETRGREPPIAFELRYKGEALKPEREYFVSAEVLVLERPLLAGESPRAVLTRGRGSKGIEIILRRAGRSPEE
jgi:putative lipoprotein